MIFTTERKKKQKAFFIFTCAFCDLVKIYFQLKQNEL